MGRACTGRPFSKADFRRAVNLFFDFKNIKLPYTTVLVSLPGVRWTILLWISWNVRANEHTGNTPLTLRLV